MTKTETTVSLNGITFSGWQSVDIQKNLDSVSGSFSLSIKDIWTPKGESVPFLKNNAVKIKDNSINMINGYIENVSISDSPKEKQITISGREKTLDLVDCFALLDSYEFTDTDLLSLAKELCEPFGISVFDEANSSGKKFQWTVQQGETVYQTLERAARKVGVLLIANDSGNLVITKIGANKPDGSLVYGKNILSGSYEEDFKDRFSKYVCRGQSNSDDILGLEGEGISNDNNITRYRPKIVLIESSATLEDCQDRANWEASTALARSIKHTINVHGWYQSARQMFEINQLINLDYPNLLANNIKRLINSVNYKKDLSGTYCTITLVDPNSYVPKVEIEKDESII